VTGTTPTAQVFSRDVEKVTSNEGINLQNKHEPKTFRQTTIQELIDCLKTKNAILVRAPFYSGKTSTAILLHSELQRIPNASVLFISMNNGPYTDWNSYWQSQTSSSWVKYEQEEHKDKFRFLIIDEAQRCYSEPNSGLWEFIKRIQRDANSKDSVILFSAYGAKAQIGEVMMTPFAFPPENVMSLERNGQLPGLLLTDEEMKEIISSFENINNFKLDRKIKNYLFHISNGFVGIVKFSLERIPIEFGNRLQVEVHSTLLDEIYFYFHQPSFISALNDCRGVSVYKALDDEGLKICNSVFNGTPLDYDEKMHEVLVKNTALLVAQNNILVFPSPSHQRSFLMAYHKNPFSHDDLPSFEAFLVRVMQRFSSAQLLSSLSRTKADGSILERQWQNEFYRAAKSILGSGIAISPDTGAYFNSKGFLDFYINSSLQWGIEILREGIDMKKHMERFQPGGDYF